MRGLGNRIAAFAIPVLCAAGCSTLAGIEDAKLDPQYDGGGDAGPTTPCGAYCNAVMANCTAQFQQYRDQTTCLAVCSHLPLGTAGEDTGDTVACRLTHAQAVTGTGEPGTECPVAGPGGSGVCGSNCDGYCTLMHTICADKFATIPDCETACSGVPDLGGYNSSIEGGNSIQCRLYHVSAASLVPSTHCPHAAGEAICVAPNSGG